MYNHILRLSRENRKQFVLSLTDKIKIIEKSDKGVRGKVLGKNKKYELMKLQVTVTVQVTVVTKVNNTIL